MDYKHQGAPQFSSQAGLLTKGPSQPALYANQKLHPTKQMQENMHIDGERKHLQEMSVLYGSHMPMRHVIEANIMAQVQRPSGYKSSMFGLNQHLGRYNEITFADCLNDPSELPEMDTVGTRARYEEKIGMYN